MTKARNMGLDALPEFASDEQIGHALLGSDWKLYLAALPSYERSGFPKRDPIFGRRYVPAVRKWLDHHHGVSETAPIVVDGNEDHTAWRTRTTRRRA